MAARATCAMRGLPVRSPGGNSDILAGSIQRGMMNCTVGAAGEIGPFCKATTLRHNPRGHEPRGGASVPGYSGVIPGKYAGNVFGKRFAMDNIHATQVRHDNHKGLEETTNWILHAENDKKQTAHGSGVVKESWGMTAPWSSTRQGITRLVSEPSGWKVYEPRATHEFLRY